MHDATQEPVIVVYTSWSDDAEDGTEFLSDEQSPRLRLDVDGFRLCLSPLKSKE